MDEQALIEFLKNRLRVEVEMSNPSNNVVGTKVKLFIEPENILDDRIVISEDTHFKEIL